MKVTQFHSKNQFLIEDDKGTYLQSYTSVIAFKGNDGGVVLDQKFWNWSPTTVKHRNLFLGETSQETKKKVESGEYKLINLNK